MRPLSWLCGCGTQICLGSCHLYSVALTVAACAGAPCPRVRACLQWTWPMRCARWWRSVPWGDQAQLPQWCITQRWCQSTMRKAAGKTGAAEFRLHSTLIIAYQASIKWKRTWPPCLSRGSWLTRPSSVRWLIERSGRNLRWRDVRRLKRAASMPSDNWRGIGRMRGFSRPPKKKSGFCGCMWTKLAKRMLGWRSPSKRKTRESMPFKLSWPRAPTRSSHQLACQRYFAKGRWLCSKMWLRNLRRNLVKRKHLRDQVLSVLIRQVHRGHWRAPRALTGDEQAVYSRWWSFRTGIANGFSGGNSLTFAPAILEVFGVYVYVLISVLLCCHCSFKMQLLPVFAIHHCTTSCSRGHLRQS